MGKDPYRDPDKPVRVCVGAVARGMMLAPLPGDIAEAIRQLPALSSVGPPMLCTCADRVKPGPHWDGPQVAPLIAGDLLLSSLHALLVAAPTDHLLAVDLVALAHMVTPGAPATLHEALAMTDDVDVVRILPAHHSPPPSREDERLLPALVHRRCARALERALRRGQHNGPFGLPRGLRVAAVG